MYTHMYVCIQIFVHIYTWRAMTIALVHHRYLVSTVDVGAKFNEQIYGLGIAFWTPTACEQCGPTSLRDSSTRINAKSNTQKKNKTRKGRESATDRDKRTKEERRRPRQVQEERMNGRKEETEREHERN